MTIGHIIDIMWFFCPKYRMSKPKKEGNYEKKKKSAAGIIMYSYDGIGPGGNSAPGGKSRE